MATRTPERAQRASPGPREARLRRAGLVGLLRGGPAGGACPSRERRSRPVV